MLLLWSLSFRFPSLINLWTNWHMPLGNLDLRAGFHQIFLQPSEEHKTTFQTHLIHYEFRVMPLGWQQVPQAHFKVPLTTLLPRPFASLFSFSLVTSSFMDVLMRIISLKCSSGCWLTSNISNSLSANSRNSLLHISIMSSVALAFYRSF